jgi:FkbM family methyltransferase
MHRWKPLLADLSRKLGWDVRKYNVANSEWLRLVAILETHRITTTIDAGANTGQFASRLRRAGFRGRIISFEPLSTAHAQLTRTAARDSNWVVAPRIALADHDGNLKINVAGNSVSSSLLPMLPEHLRAEPGAHYTNEEQVQCARLDHAAARYITRDDRVFLKLDVQGYESQVLAGAENTLPQVRCLRLEVSLVPLYEGQSLYLSMIERMNSMGFSLWGLDPAFVDPGTGKTLQLDALFCRSEKP